MLSFLDPNTLARTYRDPVAWFILAVDLFPIWAVLTLGWGAAPLVFLYWLENVIIGAVTLAKMVATSVKEHVIGLIGILFVGPFFVFHYGMFCFVHGVFVSVFAHMSAGSNDPGFPTPWGLIEEALASGAGMPTFVLAIILVQVFLFVQDFILRGEYRETSVEQEMMKPYGRVIVLHIAIFAGAFAMAALGEPMWGMLALILLRAAWGVFLTVRRRVRIDTALQLKS
ncbi:MAG: hypothetical protein HRT82_11430 [Henriciella sp.]|nr:hypothetical protein [Henriciella sp.]